MTMVNERTSLTDGTNKLTDAASGVLADSIRPQFDKTTNKLGYYELCANGGGVYSPFSGYGICHRFCPVINQLIIQTEQTFPGPSGLQRCNPAWMYEFCKHYGGVRHKYPLRRYMHDKWFLAFDFTSDELNKISSDISISGAELRRSGNFLNFQIEFGASLSPGFQDCQMYVYTECVQMVHINSQGALFLQR